MTSAIAPFKVLLTLLLSALLISACAALPVNVTPAPLPTGTLPVPAAPPQPATASPAAAPTSNQAATAVIADWEEMFRTTNGYEYVKANGKPDDKAWWIEQIKRFYTGAALAQELQHIEYMFTPRSLGNAFAFIENANYTVQVQSCASDTECTLQVSLQGGKFWAYEALYKRWTEANQITPSDWTVTLQYDPAAGHWKIK
jgi:hypothetical protein